MGAHVVHTKMLTLHIFFFKIDGMLQCGPFFFWIVPRPK